ncbi:MAG: DNA/RNA nuclease SfsA, partial [Clostridia bacterium]|nr:DNA/RNA nuclease SfsA [Clostridia bacterium]
MKYENVKKAKFISRPNRFIAHIEIDGKTEVAHVKNTGRCRELLVPNAEIYVQEFDNTARKTKYDLIAVKKGDRLINMDSQVPNKVFGEWVQNGKFTDGVTLIRPETFYGDSRFDFAFEKDGRQCYLEVKGVTLEHDGVCAFPDAPTERGAKHIRGLIRAVQEGCGAYILFVIQMADVEHLHPNDTTD